MCFYKHWLEFVLVLWASLISILFLNAPDCRSLFLFSVMRQNKS